MFKPSTLRLASQLPRIIAARGYADQAMGFTFASQNKVFYNNADVRQVDVPSQSGNFGILPSHVPSLAVLKPGVVTVFENTGTTKKIFVSSGTVTINEDSTVQLLAEEAVEVAELDLQAARSILTKSQGQVSAASSDEAKTEALIAVEVAEELVKAAESL